MRIETNGTGRFEHATVWNDDGEYIGIFMFGKEQQLIDAITEHLCATRANRGAEISANEEKK